MKAWLIDELKGIDRLRLTEAPAPVAKDGEVVMEVRYAALNPADRYLAEKQYPLNPPLPHVLGRDGMGTIIAVGKGVNNVRVGDRRSILRGDVGGVRWGTFAERVSVPADNLVEVPAGWSEEEASGATLVYLTAYQALTMWGPLQSNAVVLVTGASGGVGVASVQLAAAMGYTVVALSRSEEKQQRLKQLGATVTFDPENPKWRSDAKAFLAPRRVDLAVDNIGGKLLPEVIDTLGDLGKVSLVGRLAGPVPSFNTATLFFRRLRIGGVAVGSYTPEEGRAAWQEVLRLMAKAGARPLVDKVFPLDQLPQAFERLAKGPMGKVVLKVKN